MKSDIGIVTHVSSENSLPVENPTPVYDGRKSSEFRNETTPFRNFDTSPHCKSSTEKSNPLLATDDVLTVCRSVNQSQVKEVDYLDVESHIEISFPTQEQSLSSPLPSEDNSNNELHHLDATTKISFENELTTTARPFVLVNKQNKRVQEDKEEKDLCGRTSDATWGWLVVLGSFLCMFTVDGVCFTYGLQIVEMLKAEQFAVIQTDGNNFQLKSSLAALSLPGALMCGTYYLMGPISSALVNQCDFRLVASVGAIVTTATSLISAIFIHNLIPFTIVYGLLGGIGCGLLYLPAITVIGNWFEEYRALVVGFVMCGGGLGSALIALVIRHLCDKYSWRGTLIIISALFCQTLVGIALFRPMNVHEQILTAKLKRAAIKRALKQAIDSRCKYETRKTGRIQRGSIMARIIEEKSRQRTTSTGSLDGMVITRENQLVALSSSDAYEVAMAAALKYNASRITEVQNPKSDLFQMVTNCGSLTDNTYLETLPASEQSTSNQPCLAVLPPPVQFSHAAVHRIACAILRKLHGQNQLPTALASTFTPTPSNQTLRITRQLSVEYHSKSSITIHHSTGSRTVHLGKNVIGNSNAFDYSLFDAGRSKHLLLSSTHSELGKPVKIDQNIRHRISATESCSTPQEGNLPRLSIQYVKSSETPSGICSLISLDSHTDRVITRELNSLLLDEATKSAILLALRRELSRPKYRQDFFYTAKYKPTISAAVCTESGNSRTAAVNSCICDVEVAKQHVSTFSQVNTKVLKDNKKSVNLENVNNHVNLIQTEHTNLQVPNEELSTPIGQRWQSDFRQQTKESIVYLCEMLNMQLLKSPTFILVSIGCFLNMGVLLIPFYYIPLLLEFGGHECQRNKLWCPNNSIIPLASEDHYPNQTDCLAVKDSSFASSPFVLCVIGFASIAGRLFAAVYIERGMNSDYKQCLVDPLLLNNFALILSGLSVFAFPLAIHGVILTPNKNSSEAIQLWSLHFRRLLIYIASIVYGFTSAVTISLRSVLLVEMFGIRRLTNAFGYLLIVQGLGVICGPTLFGIFCDFTCPYNNLELSGCNFTHGNTYTISAIITTCTRRLFMGFYICAGLFILTSILFMPLRWSAKHDTYCKIGADLNSVLFEIDPHLVDGVVVTDDDDDDADADVAGNSLSWNNNAKKYDPQETQTTHVSASVHG